LTLSKNDAQDNNILPSVIMLSVVFNLL